MRMLVNVSTGRYRPGADRLKAAIAGQVKGLFFLDRWPPNCPAHSDIPYAFKAHAIQHAIELGATSILWADASIVPHQPLGPLFDRIDREGYWISRNGYRNSEWTNRAALPLLGVTAEENHGIEHVVATTFGLNVQSEIGRKAFAEYLRLAQNGSFRGPWTGGKGIQHRHDQTALSVIAHRLGMTLTDPPAFFCYKGGETPDTYLIADGIC